MVQKKKGKFSDTRKRLKKHIRDRGKVKISKFLQQFEEGDKVVIVPEPSYQKGLPFRRFWGKIAKVVGKRGEATIVELKDGNKVKRVIAANVHLKKVEK